MKLRPSLFTSLLLASAALSSAQSADLRITNGVDQPKPLFGAQVTFTVIVYNDGDANATGVTVTDVFPSGCEFVAAAPESGSYDPETGIWTIGTLDAGLSVAVAITAKVVPDGSYQYVATVSGNEDDPNTANNTAGVTPVPTWNLYWEGGIADTDPEGNPPNGASAGGNGTWDTAIKNWDAGQGSTGYVRWDNTTGYTAYFAGSAGTVTVGSDLAVGSIRYDTSNYAIAGAGYNLTLSGAGGVGITPQAFGKSGLTVSGFNTITLGSSQKWDAWSGSYGIDLTVSDGKVDTNGHTLTLGTAGRNASVKVASEITGSGNVVVARGAGITDNHSLLGSANTHTGTTTVTGYTKIVALKNTGEPSEFGTGSSAVMFNGGGFRVDNNGSTDRAMMFTGNSGIYSKQRTNTFNGPISGSGTLGMRGDYTGGDGGNGTVVLAAENDFAGTLQAALDSTLRLAHVNAAAQATITTAGTRGRIDLTTHNLAYVIGGLAGNRNLNLGTGIGDGGSGMVSIGNNNASTEFSGALSGAAGIDKIGDGILTLSGANVHTGDTKVSAGGLVLAEPNGSLLFVVTDAGSNALTGNAAATLNGKFVFNLDAVSVADGSWNIVANPAATYGDNFSVDGFDPAGDGTWTMSNAKGDWVFSQATGTLVLGEPSATPYDQWALDQGLTAGNSGKGQNPDNDVSINLLEFALGGDPLKGDAANNAPSLVKVQDVAGSPALTLTIATRAGATFDSGTGPRTATRDGVTYRVEAGADLTGWAATVTEVTPAIIAGLPAAPDGYEYHTFRTVGPVATTPKDFLRVRVEGQ